MNKGIFGTLETESSIRSLADEELAYPVKILSDIHYKSPGSRVLNIERVRELFSDAYTIILNGDTLEYLYYGERRATKHLQEISDLANEMSVKLYFVNGNHDPLLGFKEIQFSHDDRRIRVTHGDFHALRMSQSAKPLWCRPIDYILHIARFYRWSYIYFTQFKVALQQMYPREIMLLGHAHKFALKRYGDRTIINLGAQYFGLTSAAVRIAAKESQVILETARKSEAL